VEIKLQIPPGQVLLNSFLIPNQIQQKTLAAHLGWTYARLNEIINARRGITADSALSLAEAFNTTPEFWMDLQRDWDLNKAKKNHIKVSKLNYSEI
jgi:addiction module HigA family antidote